MLTLDNWSRSAFDFAGTATDGGASDHDAYVVNTGALDESGVTAGTLLQLDGLVTPFGTAPPDFTATDGHPRQRHRTGAGLRVDPRRQRPPRSRA